MDDAAYLDFDEFPNRLRHHQLFIRPFLIGAAKYGFWGFLLSKLVKRVSCFFYRSRHEFLHRNSYNTIYKNRETRISMLANLKTCGQQFESTIK